MRGGAAVAVGLEHGDHPATSMRPGRRQRHGDLGRVVRVIVDEVGAAGRAAVLEAPPYAGERGQGWRGHRRATPTARAAERGRRVQEVVTAEVLT